MKSQNTGFAIRLCKYLLSCGEERHTNKKCYKTPRRIKIFRTNKIYFLRRLDNRAPFLQRKQMQEEIILERLTIKHAGVLCVTHLII
jgi:hypothetical protein